MTPKEREAFDAIREALAATTTAMTMEGLTREGAWRELHGECRAALAKAAEVDNDKG